MANRAVFEIAYEGPALEDGIMDVNELAPALLALGNLVENSNKIVGEPDAQVKVFVRASFEKGSFQIALELIYKLSEQIRLFFDIQQASNPAERLLASIGFGSCTGLSLIGLIKRIKGRTIKNATVLDNGKVRLELDNNSNQFEYVEADEKVIRLYRDFPVRESLRKVLSPLEKEGVNGFYARKGKEIIEKVRKEEIIHFDIHEIPEAEQSTISRRIAFVNLVEVAFEEGLKWRLSDGDNKFYATISDSAFIEQMNDGKPFAKGDILKVELETRQIATQKGIKNEHRVIRVLEHVSRPRQLSFPFIEIDHKES